MRWQTLCTKVVVEKLTAASLNPEITGVQYDSRKVGGGDLFVAMRGGSVDGNRFVAQALSQGAAAIITEAAEVFSAVAAQGVASALVKQGRRALAEAAGAFYEQPASKLKLSAITGTNGKTTTAFLLDQLLRSVDRKTVLIGTVETRIAGEVRAALHTTPESRDTLALFAEGVRAGCTEAVMEFSSHALEQERVWGLPVDVAIFTNLTQDHLDYHGSMEAYARAKAKLFAGVGTAPPRVAVIHEDVAYAGLMIDSYAGEEFVVRYGVHRSQGANHWAEDLLMSPGDTRFRFVTPGGSASIHSRLSGRVNVENLLAALCAGLARGLTLEELAAAAETLQPAPGRYELVQASRAAGFAVIVDYAHTDDALRNLIALAREQVKPHGGRVLTVFGCGGDRDRAKRPKMGRVAGEGSDIVVLTSDNPRSEDPMRILSEVSAGVRGTGARWSVEPDRREAIAGAIHLAQRGDIVLLAGKGHEKVQIFADGEVPFDDVAEATRVLEEIRE